MTITLINKTRRMRVYNLSHDSYCQALGQCACTRLPTRNTMYVCASLTLPANARVSGIQEAALQVPEIARDIKVGSLAVTRKLSAVSDELSAKDTKRLKRKKKLNPKADS